MICFVLFSLFWKGGRALLLTGQHHLCPKVTGVCCIIFERLLIPALSCHLTNNLTYMPRNSFYCLFSLQPFCTPIGATSKVLQLLAILRTKDASSVSRTTWALSAFTNSSEITPIGHRLRSPLDPQSDPSLQPASTRSSSNRTTGCCCPTS